MPTGDGATLCAALKDEEILAAYERQLKKNKASGAWSRPQLETVRRILGAAPLRVILLDPTDSERRLRAYFCSALARRQHTRVILTLVQGLGNRAPPEALQFWREALETATRDSETERQELRAWFEGSKATQASIETHVADAHRMLAKLNAPSLRAVLIDPLTYREQLRQKAPEEGTAACHVQKIVLCFSLSPSLREQYPDAHASWRSAAAEHALRSFERYDTNEPTEKQAANFVPLSRWAQKLDERLAESDPHSTLAKSQATLLMAYTSLIPVKRCEMGSVRVFASDPTPQEAAQFPNHIVLGSARMSLSIHKTAKKFGPLVEPLLPEKFMSVLRASLSRWPRQYIFVNALGEPHTNKSSSAFVQRAARHLFDGKAAGVSLCRHAHATALEFDKVSRAARRSVAHRMGHSLDVQDRYRFLSLKEPAAGSQA